MIRPYVSLRLPSEQVGAVFFETVKPHDLDMNDVLGVELVGQLLEVVAASSMIVEPGVRPSRS